MAKAYVGARETLLDWGPHEEDPLIAIEQRILNLIGLSQGLTDDDHLDQFGQELDKLDREIRTSVPETAAGIAVKVRHLWTTARDDNDPDDIENLRTIHEALRLLESGGEKDFPSFSDKRQSA